MSEVKKSITERQKYMPPNDKHPDEMAKEIEFENREWLESLDYVIQNGDEGRVQKLLQELQ